MIERCFSEPSNKKHAFIKNQRNIDDWESIVKQQLCIIYAQLLLAFMENSAKVGNA
jgi:hypothetical protein